MTKTVGQFVIEGYYELEKLSMERIGKFPLPKMGEVDVQDITMMLLTFFNPHYETGAYYDTIKQYAIMKGLTEEELKQVYPETQKYITDVLTTLKRVKV